MIKKLGYYVCNDKEFDSKIRALIYASSIKKPITWIFNDDQFNTYPWHEESPFTLDELYNRRAREIREQYDYVILCYSGGSDSNNVLESFLRQGLLIDEIVTNWALDVSESFNQLSVTQRSTWNHNSEFKLHTASRLDYIKQTSPKTKITVIDTSEVLVKTFLDADDESWVLKKNAVLNATGSSQYNYIHFANIRKQFDKDKKIALVIGTDKPKLKIEDNKLYMFFADKAVNMVSIREHILEYPNAHPVFFYWDPDCIEMLSKQGHTVLHWLKANPQYQWILKSTDYKITRRMQEELLKTVVYSNWNTAWFQVFKSLNDWDSELDYWFTRGWKGTKEYEIWLAGIKYLTNQIPEFLDKDKSGNVRGTKTMYSNRFYIGSLL
jgi:hypothetical protein